MLQNAQKQVIIIVMEYILYKQFLQPDPIAVYNLNPSLRWTTKLEQSRSFIED